MRLTLSPNNFSKCKAILLQLRRQSLVILMLPLSSEVQAQTQQTPPQPITNQADPFWAVVGQYGIGIAALLAVLKAFADYQLKAAIEDRAIKSKSAENELAREERIYGSVMNQNEVLSTSQGQLLNTFIAKTLNQAEATNEQVIELIKTITSLTESIKFLGDSQSQVVSLLHEMKEYAEDNANPSKDPMAIHNLNVATLDLLVNLANQTLSTLEKLLSSTSPTNVVP